MKRLLTTRQGIYTSALHTFDVGMGPDRDQI